MSRRYSRPIVLLAAVLAGAGCHGPAGPQAVELPPIELPVATPVVREIIDYEEYPGKVMAVERVSVMARADGYLTEIRFQPGQLVNTGDVLFVIDGRPYRVLSEIAKGQLLQAEARADRLAKDHARLEKLLATGATSREDFDRVSGDLAEAQAAAATAREGSSRAAQLRFHRGPIADPRAGWPANRTVGNLVQGSPHRWPPS